MAEDGRIVSALFTEDEQTGPEDSTVVSSIADVSGDPTVIAKLGESELPLVSLTAKVDATGEVQELAWTINSSGPNMCEWRVPAKRLFTGAPGKCWMGGSFRWDEFGFTPSTFLAGWRNSSDLNVSFYKTKNGANTYSAQEVNGWGVFDFRVRLGISLSDAVDKATILVLAQPVTDVGQRALPGFADPGDSYPHICIDSIEASLGPLHNRTTGQPIRVFVHHVQADEPAWDPRELWTAVREMMADPLHCNCSQVEAWHRSVGGPGAPEMQEMRQRHSWPRCPEEEDDPLGGEADGVYYFIFTVIKVVIVVLPDCVTVYLEN